MPYLEPKELTQAKELIKKGKLKDSLQILMDFEGKEKNSLENIVSCHLIKCFLFLHQGLYDKIVKLAEHTYSESLELEKNILTVDALLVNANSLLNINKIELANQRIKQAEDLLKTLKEESPNNNKQREAYLFYIKGSMLDPFFNPKGQVELALVYYKRSLSLAESLGDNGRVSACLLAIAWIVSASKGENDIALEYIEKSLALSKEANYKFYILRSLLLKAVIYTLKGMVTQSIPLFEQSLAIAKELNNIYLITANLNNLSETYRMKGELDRALDISLQCLNLSSDMDNLRRVAFFYDSLIQILIEKGDLKQAQRYLNQLEQLNIKENDKLINFLCLYGKALLLKESPRINNRGKAQEILKQFLENEDIFWENKERVLLTLSELLLSEFQMTGDLEVLGEVESIIIQLFNTAKKSHSYWIWGETFLLQAKLAQISLNLKDARRFLTQGQQIAEKYDLTLLARKISNEHDELLKKLSMWENLKNSDISLLERMELARLNEQIGQMVRRRELELPDLPEENPIGLLIISEGGLLIFSKLFSKTLDIKEDLTSNFLSAFNSFSSELFSEGLDRATFGRYNLLMKPISTFLVCYLFKGQSFSAQKKIQTFVESIQTYEDLLKKFENYYQMNQILNPKDAPILNSLIREIFLENPIS